MGPTQLHWGQAGDHRPGTSMEEPWRERNAERAHPDTFGVGKSSIQLSFKQQKNLTLCGKLYLMFKTEMLFPKALEHGKNALWIPGALVGNELSIISQVCNVFNVSDIHIY